MRERIRVVGVLGALTLTVQLLMSGVAFAHGLTIVAEGRCEAGAPVISFTVTAFSTGFDGVHPNIGVFFNNTLVFTGAFVQATGNTFSGSAPAPAGTTFAVGARAIGPWADGNPGGQEVALQATAPDDCTVLGVGRFTGGGKQVEAGGAAKITRGLTIHCDLLLSNNLEINWDGGNNFHMLEHLETIACFDDPSIEQKPPVAPLDTLVGRGTGRFNGVDGYSIVFTLIDAGEPGSSDMMGFIITAPNGSVVINVPVQTLIGGNLQAHYDQPHKNKP
jgi:hypothetical protein